MTHDEKQLTMFDIEEAPGRPMLHWLGKRPLRAVKYYEAQLKEQYGKPAGDGWVNRLYWGDNLQVMSHLMKEFRGKIKLIYIDPPFDSKADYRKRIKLKGRQLEGDISVIEEKQYTDIWANDLYLQFMYERLQLMRELLAEDGLIFVHMDETRGHYMKIILDEIFGQAGYINEVIWKRQTAHSDTGQGAKHLGRLHDSIFIYCKGTGYSWNEIYTPYSDEYIENFYKYVEPETGRCYRLSDITAPGGRSKGNPYYEFLGVTRYWRFSKERMEELYRQGRIVQTKPGAVPAQKRYLDEMPGVPLQDIWDDIKPVQSQAMEREDYPTQKPESLVERILLLGSNPGDLVADFFCGSGTTMAVAQKLGRRWIGSDINLGAVHTTARRVSQIIKEQQEETRQQTLLDEGKKFYPAFAVYNVNHYDIFKNDLEAKEIVMKLYGVEPVKRSFFDGILDGKWVKVVELNRVCSKEDVQAVFDEILSKGEKEIEATYRRGVLILCSGHEYDVLDYAKRLNVVNIPFEIRDILTDRKDIIFKHPPEADIALKLDGGKAVVEIRQFYSPMLLQKLQLEDDPEEIDDWRQLVEAVLIDPNYDGEVLKPAVQDIPGKKDMASGVYELPLTGPGQKIAVKIVDVLSEEYFEVLEVGAR